MDLTEIRRRAAHALRDILRATDAPLAGKWEKHSLTPTDFPVPELILFGLRNLRDLESWGPGEKLRWGVTATFGNVPFSVTLEKFGLRLYVPKGLAPNVRGELVGRLKTAVKLSETYLRDLAGQQINDGNVTIENQYRHFEGAYQFFRDRARLAYETPAPEPKVTHRDKDGRPMGWSSEPWRPQIEGGYLASAMVDAYFSRLEPLLVLVLPFLDFDPVAGALVRFVGLTWDEKWREVFDVATDTKAKHTYDQLRQIKETVRNPASHGGFAKQGTSFFFHVEKIGALPALLTKHERSYELFITKVPQETYQALCSQLDESDAFLAASAVASGVQYAEAGLDVAFSPGFRTACQIASQSPEALEEFIDHQAYLTDMHTNMDY
jgi:hypothetical protein